jgi:hypothetical protein
MRRSLILLAVLCSFGEAHLIASDFSGGYGAGLSFYPHEPPFANESSRIDIFLLNATSGMPLTGLNVAHERILHVFIVGADTEIFAHLHPEEFNGVRGDGYFFVNYTFPKAGRYGIVTDFMVDGVAVMKLLPITAEGTEKMKPPQLDFRNESSFQGYKVRLAGRPEAGKEIEFAYHIEKDGRPVTNLQQYLGTEMHVFIIKDDLSQADHIHTYIPGHFMHTGSMPQMYSGPDIPVRYTFPGGGNYVIFSQFMHNNSVITARFAVHVEDSLAVFYYMGPFVAIAVALLYYTRRR